MRTSATGRAITHAFSLIELVIALGTCAFGLVTLVGLLAAAARETRQALEGDALQRVLAAVQGELATVDFGAVAGALVEEGESVGEAGSFFANPTGGRLGRADEVPAEERFFAIVLERNADVTPPATDGRAGFVVYHVRVEWPHRLPDGSLVPPPHRRVMRVAGARAR